MPKVMEVAKVMVDADTLWKEIGDFGSIVLWHPDVSRLTVSGEPGARVRFAHFETGDEQLERLKSMDATRHAYRYRVEHTSMPVRDYSGEFRLESPDPQMSRLVWEVQFTLTDAGDDRTVAAIRSFLRDGIASIEARYRPYANKEAAGVQKQIADADKEARAGTTDEPVRNTPPAGAWNDTSSD